MDYCAATIEELHLVMDADFPAFIQSFIDDSEQRVATLTALQEQQQFTDISKAAHSFKGSASNLGAVALAEACLAVDQAAQASDAEAVHKTMVLLRQAWIHARRYYSQLIQ